MAGALLLSDGQREGAMKEERGRRLRSDAHTGFSPSVHPLLSRWGLNLTVWQTVTHTYCCRGTLRGKENICRTYTCEWAVVWRTVTQMKTPTETLFVSLFFSWPSRWLVLSSSVETLYSLFFCVCLSFIFPPPSNVSRLCAFLSISLSSLCSVCLVFSSSHLRSRSLSYFDCLLRESCPELKRQKIENTPIRLH